MTKNPILKRKHSKLIRPMTRKEFVKMCGLLGIGLPLQATFSSCDRETVNPDFDGKILIIGAGAAGLTTGYLLNQLGIDFEIWEASDTYGGRMKRTTDFADFPIPLGAEWLHVRDGIFEEIVNDSDRQVNVEMTPYDDDNDVYIQDGEEVGLSAMGFSIDQKFINGTWFDFFDRFIAPDILGKIKFNQVVTAIDYTGDQVVVTSNSEVITIDKVVVTIPIKMMQLESISFTPALPERNREAIQDMTVWDGCKAFIEFSEAFYPTLLGFETEPEEAGQKLYYDAAYGQQTNKHILGLFAVGADAKPYIERSDAEMIQYILDELDAQFDNKASASYVKHIFQNWNAEPFAQGAYVYDYERSRNVTRAAESVDDKVYFAGDGYGFMTDWSSVHVAARSAKRAVDELVKKLS